MYEWLSKGGPGVPICGQVPSYLAQYQDRTPNFLDERWLDLSDRSPAFFRFAM